MKMNFLNQIAALVLAGAWVQGEASAQQTATLSEASKEGSKKISLLAVGDFSPIKMVISEKDDVCELTEEAEHPPAELFVKVKSEYKNFSLQLNCPVEAVEYPKGGTLDLYKNKADADTAESKDRKEPYVSIPLPKEQSQLTVFLFRNPATKDWQKKPLAFALKDDLVSFPRNSTRVVNLSSATVRVKLNTTIFDLSSHANRIVPYPTQGTNGILDYKVGATIEGQNMMISNFSKSYYAGTRMNLVIYDADGKQRKEPMDSVILMVREAQAPAQNRDAAPAPPATP